MWRGSRTDELVPSQLMPKAGRELSERTHVLNGDNNSVLMEFGAASGEPGRVKPYAGSALPDCTKLRHKGKEPE